MSEPALGKKGSPPSNREERRRVRWIVRGACLLAAAGMLWPAAEATGWAAVVPALSPWIAAASLLATWTLHTLTFLGCAMGIISLLVHRWFCRWICPTGLCADGASWLGRRMRFRSLRIASLGQWIVWLTLGGACFGYPILLWLDPLGMFSGLFRLGGPNWGLAAGIGAAGVPAILLISLFWPNLWCGQVCPLGAFQDLLSTGTRALRWIVRRGNGRPPRPWGPLLARRTVLGAGIGALWALTVRWVRAAESPPLRPPGALGEPEFLGVCVRCGSCLRACPSRIIGSDLGEYRMASLMTPVLSFQNDYCREDCVRCTDACPSGALEPLPLEDKPQVRIGLPRVDMNICLLGENRECSACRNHCPYEAVRYVWSESEYTLTPRIDPRKCTGCGACEVACPTKTQKAIVVIPVRSSMEIAGSQNLDSAPIRVKHS